MSLAAIILTHNESHNIGDCIASLRWADSILVYDSFSTDDTVTTAQGLGVQVIQHPFENYSKQRDAALAAVEAEWVLFVDADERVTPELAGEIRGCITNSNFDGYWIPRHNYIFGRLTQHTGWYPDYQLRLLRRAKAHYDLSRAVHELVVLDGPADYLKLPLIHYNYRDVRQFFAKQEKYTDQAAQEMYGQGIRPKPQNFILQPLRHFIWRFFTLQGYQDGLHGLRLSVFMAWYELQKYIRLRRLWRQAR
jgi:glycosyltransferase involved in cell wall biosynthesis